MIPTSDPALLRLFRAGDNRNNSCAFVPKKRGACSAFRRLSALRNRLYVVDGMAYASSNRHWMMSCAHRMALPAAANAQRLCTTAVQQSRSARDR
jgi:hypothetical protein